MDNAIYSASQVDRATDDCFFDFQLMGGPSGFKLIQYPVTLRPSWQPTLFQRSYNVIWMLWTLDER